MSFRSAITGLGLLFALTLGAAAWADPTEGSQFLKVDPPVATETGDQVEVLELFWYGCPHCYDLEPAINSWIASLPEGTKFRRMPAIFGNPLWEMHARAFYTAEALGVLDRVHEPMFDAIHKHRNRLDNEAAIAELFAQYGVDPAKFKSTFNSSLYVDSKVRRAKTLSKAYGINGVPALVINGKYRTGADAAGGEKEMFEVADYLIAREQEASQLAANAEPAPAAN